MEIVVFKNPDDLYLAGASGEIVNGIHKKMWVERFQEPGEFKFTLRPEYSRDILPIGSLITHTDTLELMMVEDHSISEEKGKPPEIVVTGRSLLGFLEFRNVGDNDNLGADTSQKGYLRRTITGSDAGRLSTALLNWRDLDGSWTTVTDDHTDYTSTFYVYSRKPLLDNLLDLMRELKMGIQIERSSPVNPTWGGIYEGRVNFNVHGGYNHIENAPNDERDYMFSRS